KDGTLTPYVPDLKVWWVKDTPANRQRLTVALEYDPRKTKKSLEEVFLSAEELTVGKNTGFRIEEVTVEDRLIYETADRSKNAEPVRKSCLVVRVSHTKDRPVFLQAEQLTHRGQEHHFYKEANSYTAIFWGVSNPRTEVFRLQALALDDLKRADPARPALGQPNNLKGPDPIPLQGARGLIRGCLDSSSLPPTVCEAPHARRAIPCRRVARPPGAAAFSQGAAHPLAPRGCRRATRPTGLIQGAPDFRPVRRAPCPDG